jgi:hypothetical protein
VRFPEALWDELDRAADVAKTSANAVLRMLAEQFLAVGKRRTAAHETSQKMKPAPRDTENKR